MLVTGIITSYLKLRLLWEADFSTPICLSARNRPMITSGLPTTRPESRALSNKDSLFDQF